MHLVLLLFMFYNIGYLVFQGLLAYGAFLFFGNISHITLLMGWEYRMAKYLEFLGLV